jgi:hypothetical protein
MNPRHSLLSITLLCFITACGVNPKSLAESHLEQIKTGKASQANQQYCMPSDSLRLHTLKSFSVTNSQEQKRDGSSYTEVTANIETDQSRLESIEKDGIKIPQKEILKQVTLEIWKSDDFYQELVKSTAKLNDLGRKTAALTGKPPTSMSTPEREKVNKESLCVHLPFKQFESE